MKKKTPVFVYWGILLALMCPLGALKAQIIYLTGRVGISDGYLWQFNTATCTFCPVLDVPFNYFFSAQTPNDVLILPNGDVLIMCGAGGNMVRYNPPSTTPVATISDEFTGGLIHPNGTIYLVRFDNILSSTLYTFNPANNTTTVVGPFPGGYNLFELFFQNGQLYGVTTLNASGPIMQVNLTNPAASIIVQTPPVLFNSATSNAAGVAYVTDFFLPNDISTYQVSTNTLTPICNPGIDFMDGLTVAPTGVAELPCVCLTSSAGTPVQTSDFACVPNNLQVDFNGNQIADYNDIIRYILYTNPANPLGSILQTNTQPIFTFSPPVQAGVTYYVARLVGDALNGTINLNDPCLDISPAVNVVWRPVPNLVSVNTGNAELCPGACTTVTAVINGTPPFTIGWQFQQNNSAITPTFFNLIQTNPVQFPACVPANAQTGNTQIIICSIWDAFCTNP